MNGLYFEGKVFNLYAEDYEYLQNNLADYISKILRTVTTGEKSIIQGFDLAISSSDDTTLKITHPAETSTGLFMLANGTIVESSTGVVDNIELSDYGSGVVNYVYVKYEPRYASYDRNSGEMIFERKTIDYAITV